VAESSSDPLLEKVIEKELVSWHTGVGRVDLKPRRSAVFQKEAGSPFVFFYLQSSPRSLSLFLFALHASTCPPSTHLPLTGLQEWMEPHGRLEGRKGGRKEQTCMNLNERRWTGNSEGRDTTSPLTELKLSLSCGLEKAGVIQAERKKRGRGNWIETGRSAGARRSMKERVQCAGQTETEERSEGRKSSTVKSGTGKTDQKVCLAACS